MSMNAIEARKNLFSLIKKVNDDHDAIEIVSRQVSAVLVPPEDYTSWLRADRKILARITEDIRRDPFNGIGKPEPLSQDGAGTQPVTARIPPRVL